MILSWSLLSFAMGLFVAFSIWAMFNTALWPLTIPSVIITTGGWLVVSIRLHQKLEIKARQAT